MKSGAMASMEMRLWPWIVACAAIAAATAAFATSHMAIACFAYLVMVTGLRFRSRRGIHAWLMSAAMLLDLAVVLSLEIQRDAVATALSFRLGPLQQAHVAASAAATALYAPVFALGLLRLKGWLRSEGSRLWHIRLGVAAFAFRTLGFLLMYSLLSA